MNSPKFKLGQKVFVYKNGKLTENEIIEVITRTTEDQYLVEYVFTANNGIFSRNRGYGISESEVFESKDDFKRAI